MTSASDLVSLDRLNDFHSGHLIADKDRKIIFCNKYMKNLTGLSDEQLLNTAVSALFTKASNIFIDSYILPLLFTDKKVEDIQLKLTNVRHKSIPVVVNINLGDDGKSYWSLYTCANRDKLQSELIKAKQDLETKSSKLFSLATTDPLTGLLNRRELGAMADRIIHQVNRNSSTLALLCIDVDYFKKVNDMYGHHVGDEVLQLLAAIFLENRRANDLVARVGGEEFIILLPDIDDKNALKIAEELRANISETSLAGVNITVSIGLVMSFKDTQTDYETLHRLSDKALYTSKKNGRNQTSLVYCQEST